MPFLHTTHYLDQGQGPPVLLLHGMASRVEDWGLQIPFFARHHRLIAPDLRGHGRSVRAGWFTVEHMAEDVGALLDQLGTGPVDVVGLSLGGCVALALSLARPAAVRRLVLVNTFARYQTGRGTSRARALRRLWLLLTGTERQMAEFIADGLFPAAGQSALRAAAVESLACTPRSVTVRAAWAVSCFDVRGKLGRIAAPTLVVSGARDTTVPLRCSRELVVGIPAARWWRVSNSGHATPMDQATAFNARVSAFLRDRGTMTDAGR